MSAPRDLLEYVYRGWAKDGGLELSEVKRLRQFEDEKRRLKQLLADRKLNKRVLKIMLSKRVQSLRSAVVRTVRERLAVSDRRAPRLAGLYL